jgi:hypothetical protein
LKGNFLSCRRQLGRFLPAGLFESKFFSPAGLFFKTTFFLAVPRQTPPEAKRFFLPEVSEKTLRGLFQKCGRLKKENTAGGESSSCGR